MELKNPDPSQILELRQRFNTKREQSPPSTFFHPVDIHRIQNEDLWLSRCLTMYDFDMELALTNLWDICKWRASYGANDLKEDELQSEYLREGSIFIHNNDVDGKPLLIFRVRLHNKSKKLDELIKIVVYWIERIQRENYMTQITIFFDMAGTGLATVDMDFIKRIIDVFKLYYPAVINYIIVYELPWVLNAAFKVIKTLLPPKAVAIMKIISKKDILQYVNKENCLASWGGTDNYEFSFVPEQRTGGQPKSSANGAVTMGPVANAGDEEPKKVHFADPSPMVVKDLHTPTEIMLQLNPPDFVNFNPSTSEATLKLKNISKTPVAFKIQTTSPEKFRVRPRCGVLEPNDCAEINIWLKSEHTLSDNSKDKFLIMAMVTESKDCNATEVAELWKAKATNSPDLEQHRLVCRMHDESKRQSSTAPCPSDTPCGEMGKKPVDLLEQTQLLSQQLLRTQMVQYVTLFVLLCLTIGFGYLLYQQRQTDCGSLKHGPKTTAFTCDKRK